MPRDIDQKIPDLKTQLEQANQGKRPTVEVSRADLDYLFRSYAMMIEIVELAMDIRERTLQLNDRQKDLDEKLRTFRYFDRTQVIDPTAPADRNEPPRSTHG